MIDQKQRKRLNKAIASLTKEGWSAEDVDLNQGTATMTRKTVSLQRRGVRMMTLRPFGAPKPDRVETRYLYVEGNKIKSSKSKRIMS